MERDRRGRFHSWVTMIPWRRKWQPTPVFLPWKFHGQRSLVGWSPCGLKELGTTERLTTHTLHQNISNVLKILELVKILEREKKRESALSNLRTNSFSNLMNKKKEASIHIEFFCWNYTPGWPKNWWVVFIGDSEW